MGLVSFQSLSVTLVRSLYPVTARIARAARPVNVRIPSPGELVGSTGQSLAPCHALTLSDMAWIPEVVLTFLLVLATTRAGKRLVSVRVSHTGTELQKGGHKLGHIIHNTVF